MSKGSYTALITLPAVMIHLTGPFSASLNMNPVLKRKRPTYRSPPTITKVDWKVILWYI